MDLNRLLAYSLRIGVLLGTILSLVGLGSWAIRGFGPIGSVNGSNVDSLLASAITGNPAGIVYLGVIILIATPIFRVALSVLFFAVEKDRKYVAITLLVLGMLVFALVSGAVV
jgi:uncharacterized membrane protein